MYHGGTNPDGVLHTLNEVQTSPATANNDLPVMTYDFQAPLGEFGQTYPQYYALRPLHLFMHDFGELLASMDAQFPAPQDLKRGQDDALRWSVRSQGNSGFIFVNNYERFAPLSAKKSVLLSAAGVTLPKMTIPSGCMAIFPVNVCGLRFATAQLVAHRDGRLYMMQIPGIPTTIALQSGKTLKNVKPRGTATPVYDNIYLLSRHDAEHLFLDAELAAALPFSVAFTKLKSAGLLRTIVKGKAKVAAAPSEQDWQNAAVYRIALPAAANTVLRDSVAQSSLLRITYRGDCARLYAAGRLVADNFYYGRPFLYGLWRLPKDCAELELCVLPLQPDAPIYLPREADRTPGEAVTNIDIIPLQ
jgi:hypothetical protein